MSENFYRAFEDAHRGSRQDIMRRMRVYLPFIMPVSHAHAHLACLDLGCGRGEWLQLLAEHNIDAEGVDLDLGMLQAAQAQGLKVRHADAIQALRDLPDGAVAAVSAFHLVEHLRFEDMQALVEQAYRVLVPGGLLILETPNPDNLQVSTSNFYLDPSHIRPIPSTLLAFIAQQAGFARSKVLGLQENPGLRFRQDLQLEDVLAGASPDYSVIAQKASETSEAESLAHLFEHSYGITTAELAKSYSAQQSRALRALRLEIHELQIQLRLATEKIHVMELHFDSQIRSVHDSFVWRLFLPLQWLYQQVRRLRQEGWRSRLQALSRKLSSRQAGIKRQVVISPLESEAKLSLSTARPLEETSERARQIESQLQPEGHERTNH